MTTVVKRSYDTETVERGLIAVAYANGNCSLARRELLADGVDIPAATLHNWRTKVHADRYLEIREQELEKITRKAADAHLALAERQIDASTQATERFMEKINDVDARDLSTAARNFSTGAGIHTDKAQLLKGEPTQIVHRTSEELLREFEAEGLRLDSIDVDVLEEETVE